LISFGIYYQIQIRRTIRKHNHNCELQYMKQYLESPLLNVLLFSLFWALEVFTAKLAFLGGAQVFPFTIQSTCITLLLFTSYIVLMRRKEIKKLSFHTTGWLLLANAIHFGIGGFLSNAGVQLTTAINAGFLLQFTIVTGTLLAWIILKERMTKAKVMAVITVMIGTFLLVTRGKINPPHIGDLLILLACIAWAVGGIIIKIILKSTSINPDVVSFFRPIGGMPVLIGFAAFAPLYPTSVQNIFQSNVFEIHQPVYVLLNAVFITFTWLFVNRTLKVASASYTAMLPAITPILLALLGVFVLKEEIEIIQIIGIVFILSSSFVAHYLHFEKH